MRISVIHDYADVFRTIKHFSKLAGHDVVIHTDAYTSAERVVEQVQGFDAVLLTQQRVPITREIVERLPGLKFICAAVMNRCTRRRLSNCLLLPAASRWMW